MRRNSYTPSGEITQRSNLRHGGGPNGKVKAAPVVKTPTGAGDGIDHTPDYYNDQTPGEGRNGHNRHGSGTRSLPPMMP